MNKKVSKKQIVSTLRSYDVTKICVLYKKLFGYVPTKEHQPYGLESKYTCLDSFELYKWAKGFSTSNKMYWKLYELFRTASHHNRRSFFEEKCSYSNHGAYEPLEKQNIVNFMLEHCEDVESNYAKRPMMGHTHLYFCSPVYRFRDYNKWCALPIKGNERFCELVVKYADRFFGPVYDKPGELNILFPNSESVIEVPSKYSEIFEYLNGSDSDFPEPHHISEERILVDGDHFLDVTSFLCDFDNFVRDGASPEMTKKIDCFVKQFKVSTSEALGDQINSSAKRIY